MALNHNISLDFHSVQAKQGHFGSSTDFIAAERRVVRRKWGARRRFWDLLPPKVLPTEIEYLDIPDWVTTEDDLWDYVHRHHPGWVRYRNRPREESL
jgi:hypothetical protein